MNIIYQLYKVTDFIMEFYQRKHNYAFGLADKSFFQGHYVFLVKKGHRFFNIT